MNTNLRVQVLSQFLVGELDNPVTLETVKGKLTQADMLYRLESIIHKYNDVPRLMDIFYGKLTNSCRKCGEPIREGYSLCLNCSI